MLFTVLIIKAVTCAMVLLFVFSSHPLTLTATLIVIAGLISLTTYITTSAPWFSLVFFMVILTAMLVLFTYISSMSQKSPLLNLPFISQAVLPWSFYGFYMKIITDTEMNAIPWYIFRMDHTPMMMLYEDMGQTTVMMVLYLLMALVVVASIASSFRQPMRSLH